MGAILKIDKCNISTTIWLILRKVWKLLLTILLNKSAKLLKKTVEKATAIVITAKQQKSIFFPQIISTKSSYYIHDRPVTGDL